MNENELVRKLRPDRFTGMSPKMAAIVGGILGEHWTQPEICSMSVTSDGFVTFGFDGFLGHASDLLFNLRRLVEAAQLEPEEIAEFKRLSRQFITSWQHDDELSDWFGSAYL